MPEASACLKKAPCRSKTLPAPRVTGQHPACGTLREGLPGYGNHPSLNIALIRKMQSQTNGDILEVNFASEPLSRMYGFRVPGIHRRRVEVAGSLHRLAERVDVFKREFLSLHACASDIGEYVTLRSDHSHHFDVKLWRAKLYDMDMVAVIEVDQLPRFGSNPHCRLILR
jgi:hypothetical protein